MAEEALSYFLNILAKKDYSKKELADKALIKGYEKLKIHEAINYLIDKNYVNDQRLGENLVELYAGNKGKNWIKLKLTQRKIPSDLTNSILEKTTLTNINHSIKLKIERKYSVHDWKNIDVKTKQKILAFLQRQGFTNSYDILKNWLESD